MQLFAKILIFLIAVSQLVSCIDSTPQISNSNSSRLSATETASKEDKIKEIQFLYRIIDKSSMSDADKAALKARLDAALASLNDPNISSDTLAKIISDIASINDDVAKSTGSSSKSTATATAAPDTSPPPALSAFTGATGTASAAIDLTITYPANVSDYDIVVIRRSTGASAPADCSSGTSVKTYTSFANVVYTDATPSGGTAYSYRACIYDAAGNLTSSNTAENITSFTFTHTIFVTSTTYNGNLGGLAGADAKCNARASAAGLSGTFRALISSNTVSARDRIVVQGEIKNTLGETIATSKADLLDGTIVRNLKIDESANSAADDYPWTGSNVSVAVSGLSCTDWTDSVTNWGGTYAANFMTNTQWINFGSGNCSGFRPIYCISQPAGFDLTAFSATTGTGSNGDIDVTITFPATSTQFQTVDVRRISGATPPNSDCASDGTVVKTFSAGGFTSQTFTDATGGSGLQYSYRACVYDTVGTLQSSSYATKINAKGFHRIFISSTYYSGNLGGIAGADAKCTARAAAVGLAGTWRAIVSTSTENANANVIISGPVYDMTNTLIAANSSSFWQMCTHPAISYDETGTYYSGSVWTGSTFAGISTGDNCSDWTSTAGNNSAGYAWNVTGICGGWMNVNMGAVACTTNYSLYCISQ